MWVWARARSFATWGKKGTCAKVDDYRHCLAARARSTAARSVLMAEAGPSGALNTAVPATMTFAPASAAAPTVLGFSPPSTWMFRCGNSARSFRTCRYSPPPKVMASSLSHVRRRDDTVYTNLRQHLGHERLATKSWVHRHHEDHVERRHERQHGFDRGVRAEGQCREHASICNTLHERGRFRGACKQHSDKDSDNRQWHATYQTCQRTAAERQH